MVYVAPHTQRGHVMKRYHECGVIRVIFDGRRLAVVYGDATWPSFSYMYFMWSEDEQ